jgi:DNA-directed RNA polymerase specialized sigma24 family protein
MADLARFHDPWDRVRAGDAQAAADLVRRFEPLIRHEVRLRMTDSWLARAFDSADICQSVLASLFARAACRQFDLTGPDDLVCLLLTMARSKVASKARRQRARPADDRVDEGVDVQGLVSASASEDPGRIALGRDLVEQILGRLSPEERRIAELRGEGATWEEGTAAVGGTAEGWHKQLAPGTRALGLDQEELDA